MGLGPCPSLTDTPGKLVRGWVVVASFAQAWFLWQGSGARGGSGPEGLLSVAASSSMVIRDLTLRSAASFGSFHLIRLLYDEYMFYLVEHRVAEATGETPIAVMGEVSAPHPHPGTRGQASGSKRPHRGGSAAGRELACPSRTDTGRPWLLSPPYETRAGCPASWWQRTQSVSFTFSVISQ